MRHFVVLWLLISINCYGLEISDPLSQIFSINEKNPQRIGLIVSLKGQALIERAGKKQLLEIKEPIYLGDKINTLPEAFVQIDFLDHSKISLHGNSDFSMSAYRFPDKEKSEYIGRISNGFLSFMAGQIGKIAPQNYKIETSSASIGIRGSSGQILTSDGSIPGRPKRLEVMKKGGLGLTLRKKRIPSSQKTPQTPQKKAPLIVTESGQGYILAQNDQLEKTTFIQSPLEKHRKEEAIRSQKKLEKQLSKKEEKKEPKEKSIQKEKKERVELAKLEEKDPEKQVVKKFFKQEEQSFYQEFEQAFISFELEIPDITEIFEELNEIVKDVENLRKEIVADFVEDEREETLYEQQQIVLNTNSIDYLGLQSAYTANSSSQESLYVQEKDKTLSFYNELFETLYEIDYESSSDLQLQTSSAGHSALLLHDQQEEFFIVNLKKENSEALVYFGKMPVEENAEIIYEGTRSFNERVISTLPSSGRLIYENFAAENSVKTALESQFSNALLSNNGQAIDQNIAFNDAMSIVDFSTKEVLGLLAYEDSHYATLSHNTSFENGYSDYGNWQSPKVLYRANLGEDGSIENLRLYRQLGVAATEQTVLENFAGQGQLFGSSAQGLGVHASDGSQAFFVQAAMKNENLSLHSSKDGTYQGYLHGIHLNLQSPNYLSGDLSLSTNFNQGTLNGQFNFAGKNTLIDGLAFDNSLLFSEIQHASLQNSSSFITGFDLPRNNQVNNYDILWGSWNAYESSSSFYPGMHNFWSASIPGSLSLGAENIYFDGLLGNTHIETQNGLIQNTTNLSAIGVSKFVLNPQNNQIKGLHFLSSGKVLIFDGSISNSSSFSGDLSAVSLEIGDSANADLFPSSFDNLGSLQGQFTTQSNLSFDYQRQSQSTSELEILYGAGLATQENQQQITDLQFVGNMEGINFANSGSIHVLEGGDFGVDIALIFDALASQGEHEMDLIIAATDNFNQNVTSLLVEQNTHNTFITKDAFFAHVDSRHYISNERSNISFGSSFTPELADPLKSYIIGLPGLEDHLYSSWGMWNIKGASSNDQLFGYFSMARTESEYLADLSQLALQSQPLYHYEGPAIASVFDPSNPNGRIIGGSSSFDVNFYNGQVMGQVQLVEGQNIYFDGWNIANSTSYEGSSSFNGNAYRQSFSMTVAGAQAQELVGSFSVADAQSAISGAFGAKHLSTHQSDHYFGKLSGLAINASSVEVLDGVQLGLYLDAGNQKASGTISINDSANEKTFSLRMSQEGNTFLHKDNFFSLIQSYPDPALGQVSLGNAYALDFVDPNFSIISAMGGLEDYEYISWGKWLVYGSQTQALGYYGLGRSNTVDLINPSEIIANNPGTITYSGISVASIFTQNNPNGIEELGQSSLSVNFAQGNINGSIQLPSLEIQLLNGSISGQHFQGQTRLNGVDQSLGFYGTFYGPQAQEAAGSFHAKDSTYRVTGAFGAKKN